MDVEKVVTYLVQQGLEVGLKLVAALVIWFAGRWLIGLATGLIRSSLNTRDVDPTLTVYAEKIIETVLNVVLVVALLGYFGVETASFAALLAGVGLAIGTAWGGLLQNFAAGVFMVILRPIHVGDDVSVAGVTGTVESIGLVTTTINTAANVRTVVGNNAVFTGTIENFSANPYRVAVVRAQLSADTDYREAMVRLVEGLKSIDTGHEAPNPRAPLVELNAVGCQIELYLDTKQSEYLGTLAAMRGAILDVVGAAGYSRPTEAVTIVKPL